MKRPLLYILGFYIIGIIVGQYIFNKGVIVLFFMLVIGISILLYKSYLWKWIVLFPAVTLLGFMLIHMDHTPRNEIVQNSVLQREKVIITGKVIDVDVTSTNRPKLIVETKRIKTKDTVIEQKLKIQMILEAGSKVCYNQHISVSGVLEDFDFKRNPGGFDEKLYMKTKKMDYKMFADNLEVGNIKKPSFVYTLHERLNRVYDAVLPQKEASTLKLMLLGDSKTLDHSIKELYQKSGISHILAISGTHISILSAILFIVLKRFGLSRRLNSAIVLGIIIFYCILTGNNVSAVRSVVMIGIVLLGNILYRKPDLYNSVAAAALIQLVYQPLYIFDGAFQLSFSAVIGIMVLTPLFCRLYFIPDKIRTYLAATFAATLATYPIVAYHFYTVSIVGLLVNIMILPFAALLVGFGLLAGIIGLISIQAAKFTCGIVYVILKLYETICIIANKLPFASMVIGQPNSLLIVIYYSMVVIMAYYLYLVYEKRIQIKRWVMSVQLCLTMAAMITLFRPKNLKMVYLDVGQGDAIAIHTKDNKNMLIDGGGNINKAVGESNTGSTVLMPYFNYKGIHSIDTIFITHCDGDHVLGIIELIGLINIKQIVVADIDNIEDNELYLSLCDKATINSVPIVKMEKGDMIRLKDLQLLCIYPSRDKRIEDNSWNNGSLVLYIKHNNDTFMFTGDIEQEAERDILRAYEKLEVDVLKLPHHGSRTSSSEAFVNRTKPKVGIISSGLNNRYGHPAQQVVKRYEKINTKLYNTAYTGAIIVESDGDSIRFHTMKERDKYEGIKSSY